MGSRALANGASGKDNINAGNPNQTLYLSNLNDKINKNEIKRALYMLFSTYGPVLDIVTTRKSSKGKTMRGQAHIVYRDIATGTQAMRALQGFDLFGKEMKIVYGRGESNILAKLRGTFAPTQTAASTTAETALAPKSIFSAPPSGIPTKPIENGVADHTAERPPQGLKRPRDEEEEEESQDEAPMEEDEDDAPMEEDDDD